MKEKFIIILLLLFSIHCNAQESFPINFTSDSLRIAIQNINNWNGKIISLKGEITTIKKGYENKPYFLIKLGDSLSIWAGFLLNTNKNDIRIKDTVKILGYFTKVNSDDKVAKKYNKSNFHVLCFAILNLRNKKLLYHPGANKQVSIWARGKIPNSTSDNKN